MLPVAELNLTQATPFLVRPVPLSTHDLSCRLNFSRDVTYYIFFLDAVIDFRVRMQPQSDVVSRSDAPISSPSRKNSEPVVVLNPFQRPTIERATLLTAESQTALDRARQSSQAQRDGTIHDRGVNDRETRPQIDLEKNVMAESSTSEWRQHHKSGRRQHTNSDGLNCGCFTVTIQPHASECFFTNTCSYRAITRKRYLSLPSFPLVR